MAGIKGVIDGAMQRKMDRAEFLRLSAFAVVGLVGVTRFLETFQDNSKTSQESQRSGFGSGVYGGVQLSQQQSRPAIQQAKPTTKPPTRPVQLG